MGIFNIRGGSGFSIRGRGLSLRSRVWASPGEGDVTKELGSRGTLNHLTLVDVKELELSYHKTVITGVPQSLT